MKRATSRLATYLFCFSFILSNAYGQTEEWSDEFSNLQDEMYDVQNTQWEKDLNTLIDQSETDSQAFSPDGETSYAYNNAIEETDTYSDDGEEDVAPYEYKEETTTGFVSDAWSEDKDEDEEFTTSDASATNFYDNNEFEEDQENPEDNYRAIDNTEPVVAEEVERVEI